MTHKHIGHVNTSVVPQVWLLISLLAVVSTGCHFQPAAKGPAVPSVGGTIAGLVTLSPSMTAVTGRKVTIVEVKTGKTYETTTGADGGYTVQVPKGTYHIDVALRPGEILNKRPADTEVGNSDLDPNRNFEINFSR